MMKNVAAWNTLAFYRSGICTFQNFFYLYRSNHGQSEEKTNHGSSIGDQLWSGSSWSCSSWGSSVCCDLSSIKFNLICCSNCFDLRICCSNCFDLRSSRICSSWGSSSVCCDLSFKFSLICCPNCFDLQYRTMFLPSLLFVVKISSNFPRDVHIRHVTLPPLQIGFSTNLGQSDEGFLDVPKNKLILISLITFQEKD